MCLRKQPPRVAFKNNDIYMVNDKESNTYEEPKERNPRVMYKLKVCNDPALKKTCPMRENSMTITTNQLKRQQCKDPLLFWLVNSSVYYTWKIFG